MEAPRPVLSGSVLSGLDSKDLFKVQNSGCICRSSSPLNPTAGLRGEEGRPGRQGRTEVQCSGTSSACVSCFYQPGGGLRLAIKAAASRYQPPLAPDLDFRKFVEKYGVS